VIVLKANYDKVYR